MLSSGKKIHVIMVYKDKIIARIPENIINKSLKKGAALVRSKGMTPNVHLASSIHPETNTNGVVAITEIQLGKDLSLLEDLKRCGHERQW